jgi:hypothetical protein
MASKQAGNYDIRELYILNTETGNSLELNQIFAEINLFESIYSSTITGWIKVNDANNIISGNSNKTLPILGNELIVIDINVPEHNETKVTQNSEKKKDKYFRFIGRIIDIKNRTILAERSQSFEIHFVSEELILDRNIRISKSFTNKTTTQIIKNIFDEFGSLDTYEFEKTVGITNVVIPNWTPLKAIKWLTYYRSYSSIYNSPTFFFFQTLYNDGPTSQDRLGYTISEFKNDTTSKYWFLSIDDMMAYEPRKKIFFRPGNLTISDKDIADYQYSNAINYNIVSTFNTITSNANGMYNNTLLTHNIVTKKWNNKVFNYNDYFDSENHLEEFKLYPGNNDLNNRKFDSTDYKNSLLIYNTVGTPENPNFTEKISSRRTHRLATLDQYKIQIVTPGDCTLESGDIIYFDLPSLEPGGERLFDKYYSGNLLITHIRHSIDRTQYTMTIECCKDTLKQGLV